MAGSSTQSGQVLLLEDEALITIAPEVDLEDARYTVAGPFVTCASALEWLADHRPDLAIVDTALKDDPCKEVALRLTSFGVPFLVYSRHQEDLGSLPESVTTIWVEKPATAEVLLKAIVCLRQKQATSA